MLHALAMQTIIPGHTWPQAPQFIRSCTMSVQVPLQRICPAVQSAAQVPERHARSAVQGRPHPPQFRLSLRVSVQVAPHIVLGGAQPPSVIARATHEPDTQAWPAAHACPHVAQLAGSTFVLRQIPLQLVNPTGQPMEHAPPEQIDEPGHAMPHVLQFIRSLFTSVHRIPHSICPIAQTCVQVPATHTRPTGHRVPQVPQLVLSVCVSTQCPEQSVCPIAQTWAQAPMMQICPAAHALLHRPQLAWSVITSTHAAPQVVVPAGHGEKVQRPVWQTYIPVHAVRQLPQLFRSVITSVHTPLHAVCPSGHTSAHRESAHCSPAAHTWSQVPQCSRSVRVFAQIMSVVPPSPGVVQDA